MDDPFVGCPYDPAHRVPRSRIQRHIVKCQEKYPALAICPYNATHRYPQAELKKHVMDCPSRAAMFPEDRPVRPIPARIVPKTISQNRPENDPNHEMWDD